MFVSGGSGCDTTSLTVASSEVTNNTAATVSRDNHRCPDLTFRDSWEAVCTLELTSW